MCRGATGKIVAGFLEPPSFSLWSTPHHLTSPLSPFSTRLFCHAWHRASHPRCQFRRMEVLQHSIVCQLDVGSCPSQARTEAELKFVVIDQV